jgi:hypothetical protein
MNRKNKLNIQMVSFCLPTSLLEIIEDVQHCRGDVSRSAVIRALLLLGLTALGHLPCHKVHTYGGVEIPERPIKRLEESDPNLMCVVAHATRRSRMMTEDKYCRRCVRKSQRCRLRRWTVLFFIKQKVRIAFGLLRRHRRNDSPRKTAGNSQRNSTRRRVQSKLRGTIK